MRNIFYRIFEISSIKSLRNQKGSGSQHWNWSNRWKSTQRYVDNVTQSWVSRASLIKFRGTTFTKTSLDIWMEEGWYIHVVATNLHTIANIDFTVSISCGPRVVRCQDWSSIFGDTKNIRVWLCLPCWLQLSFDIIRVSASFCFPSCLISNTWRSSMVMENTCVLWMSSAPIDLLSSSVGVCFSCHWIEWIGIFCRKSVEQKNTRCSYTPIGIFSRTFI